MRPYFLCMLCAVLFLAPARPAPAETGAQAGKNAAISIVEAGADRQNNRLYNVQADGAEIADLLKTLFARAGESYAIAQDVVGPVDLQMKGATLQDVLKRIALVARPAIKFVHDAQGWHVLRDMEVPQRVAGEIQTLYAPPGIVPGGAGFGGAADARSRTQVRPLSSQLELQVIPAGRYVTLDVPEVRPIALQEAISRISAQSGFPVTVDRRVPRGLMFYGQITRAPLPLVLQTIAQTSGLKLISDGMQAMLVPPDQFTLKLNNILLGNYAAVTCSKCGQQVLSSWSFCPNCGNALSRQASPPNLLNQQRNIREKGSAPGAGQNRNR